MEFIELVIFELMRLYLFNSEYNVSLSARGNKVFVLFPDCGSFQGKTRTYDRSKLLKVIEAIQSFNEPTDISFDRYLNRVVDSLKEAEI